MTVAARTAKDVPMAANPDAIDMRGGGPVHAGTFAYDGPDLTTGWHVHDLHQVEYAFQGVVEVETEAARYLLPPQQAVWIPAGLSHNSTLKDVRSVSVFFDPQMVADTGARARILAAAPVLREMFLYGLRWPITRASSDDVADTFFAALADLVGEWLDREVPLSLPTSTHPVVAAAMAYTQEHLAGVSVAEVCDAVGVSERTLRRLFIAATGGSWKEYLFHARLLRATALLCEPDATVLHAALSVGFASPSAFTRAFRLATGESPAAYRRRVTARG